MIIEDMVVWMSDPETSRGLICVQQTPGSLYLHDKISFAIVVCLNSILDKEDVTFAFVNNIVCQSQVVSSVHCECSIVTLMNGITVRIRVMNGTNHVEMDSISSKFECLTDISEFGVR
jgi:hypothetical protein